MICDGGLAEAHRRRTADGDYSPTSSEVGCDRVRLACQPKQLDKERQLLECPGATLPGPFWWPWGRGWA
jgi:hypothetical protein